MSKSEPELLHALPKVETHCHLDGSVRPETAFDLAESLKIDLPADGLEELRDRIVVSEPCGSLKECLDVFRHLYPLLRDPLAVERIAYEIVEDSAAENIRHVEVRLAPVLQATERFPEDDVIAAVLRGLRRGRKEFGVSAGVIVCLYRGHSPAENGRAFECLRSAFRPANGLAEPGVVGMDLAGDESRHPLREFAGFFERAGALGIPATCHAGETDGTENLRDALDLGVRRIGHGLRLADDDALLESYARKGVAVETSLTSNLRTRAVADLASHPARRLHEAGVPLTLNTDDRGLFDITLTHEFLAARQAGFSLDDVIRISRESVDHLFLPPGDRKSLRSAIEDGTERLFPSRRACL